MYHPGDIFLWVFHLPCNVVGLFPAVKGPETCVIISESDMASHKGSLPEYSARAYEETFSVVPEKRESLRDVDVWPRAN